MDKKIIKKIHLKEYLQQKKMTVSLRDALVPRYISYVSFYRKLKNNTFSSLEIEKIEEVLDVEIV